MSRNDYRAVRPVVEGFVRLILIEIGGNFREFVQTRCFCLLSKYLVTWPVVEYLPITAVQTVPLANEEPIG